MNSRPFNLSLILSAFERIFKRKHQAYAQIRTRLRREIRTLLREIKAPSIFITHDHEEALELGDRIAVLN